MCNPEVQRTRYWWLVLPKTCFSAACSIHAGVLVYKGWVLPYSELWYIVVSTLSTPTRATAARAGTFLGGELAANSVPGAAPS